MRFCFVLILFLFASCATSTDISKVVKQADELCEQNKQQEASYLYHQAIQKNNNDPVLHLNLASLYYQLSKYPLAHRYYSNADKLAPDNPHGLIGMVKVRLAQTNQNAAQELLGECENRFPKQGACHYYKAHLYLKQKQNALAASEYSKAIDKNFYKQGLSYLERAQIYMNQLGEYAKAKNDLKIFLEQYADKQPKENTAYAKSLLEKVEKSSYDF